ncbi:hypothetical protein [Streptomyces zagrosensis]|uniref:Uncharacterized protein n=1 Tax=Streptomyces zagrosensis TaxID=1042984 RepID=A0A7W9V1R5_9ACTN|nr:hypothetical protein [Streptomyces zagrosensis]MBB5939212.1 hypothetical protein [Streptomyces zagrosensis]
MRGSGFRDGEKSNLTFEVWTTDASGKAKSRVKLTDANEYGVLVSPFVASGSKAQVTVPTGKLVKGVTYVFHTSAYDGSLYETGWSPWSTFKVNVPAPAKPAKPSTVVNNGKPGEFTVSLPAATRQSGWSGSSMRLRGDAWTPRGRPR